MATDDDCVRCGQSVGAHITVIEADTERRIHICPTAIYSNDGRDVGRIYKNAEEEAEELERKAARKARR